MNTRGIGHATQKGSSLIETLVAVVLLGLSAVVIGSLSLTTIKTNRHSRNLADATHVAMQHLEELRASDYTTIVSGSDGPIDVDGNAGGIYTRDWVVTDDMPLAGSKTIRLSVSWTDVEEWSVRFSTIISDNP